MYVTSTQTHTHTHMQTHYMWMCMCVQLVVTSFWARLRRDFAIASAWFALAAWAPPPWLPLSLLRVASTCAEANDDHSVRNAPEAAQKPIDYYLPHYISSFKDVSSEQIISFVRLDTFKVKRERERERSCGPGTDPDSGPGPFGQTGLTGRQKREQERERVSKRDREVEAGIWRHSWLHTPCSFSKELSLPGTVQGSKEGEGRGIETESERVGERGSTASFTACVGIFFLPLPRGCISLSCDVRVSVPGCR